MDMSMGSGSSSLTPLNDSGVDFSNFTQAYDFQQEILDDAVLQVIANSYARYFWYGIVVVIGIAALFNVSRKAHLRMRIRAAAANRSRPTAAKNEFTQFLGGLIAVSREATYPKFSSSGTYLAPKVPPFGIILLLLTYLSFLMALEFQDNDIAGAQHYTSLGVRASWLAVAQIPLLLLLAGKANLIGALVGVSYERLNVLHRWVARGMLLLITLHFGYQSYGWNQYGLMQLEWNTDTCPPTGIAAYSLLLWLNITSLAPIRNAFYEVFVVQHVLSFIAFVYLVMAHIPPTALYARVWVYSGIGIFFLDRLLRTIRYTYNNIRPATASLTALEGGVTRIRVQSKQIKSWTPGSHVFLAIPRLGFGQSHPATIASSLSSHNGDLIFILRSRKGFTNRIHKLASSSQTSILPHPQSNKKLEDPHSYLALIGGPYGASHSDPAAFDTVLMISCSTGITFTLSNLLSLSQRSQSGIKLPLRALEFIWVVKLVSWTSWVAEELASAVTTLQANGIEVKVKIHVTCEGGFDNEKGGSGCGCDLSLGPCCCETDVQEANTIEADEITTVERNDEKTGNQKITSASLRTSSDVVVKSERVNLPFATFVSGRPNLNGIVWDLAEQAEGEMGIYACGPLGLNTEIRNTVASVSDERAVHKGTGAEGIYLHVEGFCW